MDFISHGLIGFSIGQFDNESSVKKKVAIGLTAMLPDLFQIPYYIFLGYLNKRNFFIPLNEDWSGFRGQFPLLDLLWDVPHSLLFFIIVVVPIILKLGIGKIFMYSYLSHILVDIPTHTGEWNVKYFFPFDYTINGFADTWTWNISYLSISWIILILFNVVGYKIKKSYIFNEQYR